MIWFTVLYSDTEEDANVIPVMVELSQSHIDAIHKGQKASKQLEWVIDIILRLIGDKLPKPKITFFDEGFDASWTEYEGMLVKIDADGKVAISVSYIETYGSIEQRFVYSSDYDNFDPTAEYLIGDDFLSDYLQDADNLLRIKEFISNKDYELLVEKSCIFEEQENTKNIRRQ
jgi:hypothetical protein